MRKIYITLIVLSFLFTSTHAQNAFFAKATATDLAASKGKVEIKPSKFEASTAAVTRLRNFLWSLPAERSVANHSQAPVLSLPMPDGSTARFHVWESSVQEPGLEAKFPEIKTFAGQGIDDPYATIRFDFNPYSGFKAQILSPYGRIYIDPYAKGDIEHYISYYQRDYQRANSGFQCMVKDEPVAMSNEAGRVFAGPCRGTELRTYRLAVACAGEYAQAVGGGAAGPTHAAIVTSVNRLTQVYEVELAIRLVLVANNNLIEFLDPATDPFTNDGDTDLDLITTNINSRVGVGNYDIGHLFCTFESGGVGAGVAYVGVVCGSDKGGGLTGRSNPTGDGYDIDYVAHEMGHQFSARHTFNTNTCFSAGGWYEPGGGTTIMAYAGICGNTENIQPNSDPVFHAYSFDQISTFITSGGGANCGTVTPTGNTLPVITSMTANNVNIPIGTPFTLNATATDANGDAVTYNWEGWDRGTAGSWPSAATSTTRPLFRTRTSKTTGSRTFPDMRVIVANYPGTGAPSAMDGLRGETLPQVARAMKFRLTVRDNRAGGGGVVSSGDGCQGATVFQVNAVGTQPFAVTSPNGGESYPGGSSQTVTWNVAGSNAAPVNSLLVKISLSTDGGFTYPTVLVASTANDGSEAVTLPDIATTTARVKVEAVDNIFFDISNNNFTITAAPTTGFDFGTPAPATVACGSAATASIVLSTTAIGSFSTPIVLSATGAPAGTTVTITPGTVTPGSNATITLNNVNTLAAGSYPITITGTAGTVTKTREITYTVQPGAGPAITTQPQSQQLCAGGAANFSVVATGAVSYQWQVSTNGGTSYSPIGGATAATYSINPVTVSLNNNMYRCIVTGQCNTTQSNAAILTVQTAPAITTPPQSQTLCTGSPVSFTAAATGTGLFYQWEISTNGGTSFSPIGGATAATYSILSITSALNNNQYRVVVSGTCPTPATSAAAVLTVIVPPTVTTQPASVPICATGTTSFTVAGSGTGILYQWQVSTDGGTNFANIGGATNATLQLTNVTTAMNNNRYRALLSNATCTTPVASNAATLTVNARPTVDLGASPLINLLPGQSTTLTANIQPSATGFAITWYKNNTVMPGITGTSYLVDSVEIGDYQVKIVNTTTGCNNESQVVRIGTSASSRLFIFPSPNDGRFTVSYYNSTGNTTRQTITVLDAKGAKVYQRQFNIAGPYQLLNVNIQPAATGIYIVVVHDASGEKLAEGKILVH